MHQFVVFRGTTPMMESTISSRKGPCSTSDNKAAIGFTISTKGDEAQRSKSYEGTKYTEDAALIPTCPFAPRE